MAANVCYSKTDAEYLPGSDEFDSDSDTDLSNYETDDEEIEARHMADWKIVSYPFVFERQTPLVMKDRDYILHPAVDFDENASSLECFESFVPPNVAKNLCTWTNEKAGKYFIVEGCLCNEITWTFMERAHYI
ncbi:hypothetical protein AVEN_77523-1 [Araneus ventricosus]|uniref:PiggyBac transposable element-derived protein domain-containing protein n=1 Tax=Araneus ventricosus TaxID=182803 RepID=A0A4Y2F206_ARAVE|nr:hypothetical protein AVEN_77523-1 [Araneus ventricosus]